MALGRAKLKRRSLVAVPDLRGLTVLEAAAVAGRVDLLVTDPDGRPFTLLEGLVTEQLPGSGMPVPRLTTVTVWTSGPGREAGVREPRVPPLLRRDAGAEADRPDP